MRSRLGATPSSPSSSSLFTSHLDNTFGPDNNTAHDSLHNNIDFDDGPSIAADSNNSHDDAGSGYGYRVYRERWLMLFYLSLLNLLSDWTGLSVAPIATITSRAYNSDDDYIYANDNNVQMYIQPEALVTVFLIASSIGTALEPWILGRLGLRRTIVFGAFCNMLGKSRQERRVASFFHCVFSTSWNIWNVRTLSRFLPCGLCSAIISMYARFAICKLVSRRRTDIGHFYCAEL